MGKLAETTPGRFRKSVRPGTLPASPTVTIRRYPFPLPAAVLALAGLFVAPTGVAGQVVDIGVPGSIQGVVLDRASGRPIEGVEVAIRNLGTAMDTASRRGPWTLVTGKGGRFVLSGLGDGRYAIALGHVAYAAMEDSLTFRAVLGLRVRAELVARTVDLEPLLVAVEARSSRLQSAGFYDRMERGVGRFVARDEIEDRRPARVSDLLRALPGIRVTTGRQGGVGSTILYRSGCVPDVYLDGARAVTPFPFDDVLHPDEVDGIEVYSASELPAQFGNTQCGAVVLWTRMPPPSTGSPFDVRKLFAGLGFVLLGFLLTR